MLLRLRPGRTSSATISLRVSSAFSEEEKVLKKHYVRCERKKKRPCEINSPKPSHFSVSSSPHVNYALCVRTAAQVSRENVLGCDEKFLAEVRRLRGAVGQQLQHALHHLLRVFPHQVLIGHTHTQEIMFKSTIN